ncbi:hypothetical protein [Thalassospira xiamenensis]|uniref:hypothetical protein n=1 Tax=Thalassospira xiamenensis TaxID=220697 RepID=UPI000DEDE746|nr:hypothetical protein [Thalassospira xiamenensis]RCK32233.1 hypothetical protein TH24_22395 [Thalassospira xiamenensis]
MEAAIVLILLAVGLVLFKADKVLKAKKAKELEMAEKEKFEKYKPKDLPETKEEFVQRLFHISLNTSMDKGSFRTHASQIVRWDRANKGEKSGSGPFDKEFMLGPGYVRPAIELVQANVGPNFATRCARAFSYSGFINDKGAHDRGPVIKWEANQKVYRRAYNAALETSQRPGASEEEKGKALLEMKSAERIINEPCPMLERPGKWEERGVELSFKVLDGYADLFYEDAGPLDYEKFKARLFTFPKKENDAEEAVSDERTEQAGEKAPLQ